MAFVQHRVGRRHLPALPGVACDLTRLGVRGVERRDEAETTEVRRGENGVAILHGGVRHRLRAAELRGEATAGWRGADDDRVRHEEPAERLPCGEVGEDSDVRVCDGDVAQVCGRGLHICEEDGDVGSLPDLVQVRGLTIARAGQQEDAHDGGEGLIVEDAHRRARLRLVHEAHVVGASDHVADHEHRELVGPDARIIWHT
mmetsp:Transcript_85253/g.275142  ORF Transcript_85253/g.275142 Transcript_85253/m.275142 type:complete len:201 (-) Transcript_85253:704-1306(-)